MLEICAVVVTYNRKDLLRENLLSLGKQTKRLDKIIVIDNCSTDNTSEEVSLIKEKNRDIQYVKLGKNIGGAGGFNLGLKMAYYQGFKYIWIMDDDTVPEPDALENLVENNFFQNNELGFICSNVLWSDLTPCLMNISSVEYPWNIHLQEGLIKIKDASFVSLLLSRDIIEKVGFPIKQFFIWGDDYEYTTRITKNFEGYLAIHSKVFHKMKKNLEVNIVLEDEDRIERYIYEFRNRFFIARITGVKPLLQYVVYILKTIYLIIFRKNESKRKKVKIVLKGVWKGLFFAPVIEFPNESESESFANNFSGMLV